MPGLVQGVGQGELLGDLGAGEALVEAAQRLVVEVGVEVPLELEERPAPLLAPGRPVVGGEGHLGPVREEVDGLGEVASPLPGVPDERTAQRDQVVEVVGGVLGHAEGGEVREVEVHLRRRLGAGGELELDGDPLQDLDLTGVGDVEGGGDERDGPRRRELAQPAADVARRAGLEGPAVHVHGPAGHGGAGVDVLGDGVAEEALGGEHDHVAGGDLGVGGDPLHAPEVVHVAVGVDHRLDRTVAPVLPVQGEGGGRGLGRDQRVDDDHAGVALDDGHVGEVEAPHLVDPGRHLEQALDAVQLALAPEAGVRRRRAVPLEEVVGVVVPHDPTVGVVHDAGLECRDEAAAGVLEVLGVVEGEVGAIGHGLIMAGAIPRSRGRWSLRCADHERARPVTDL